MARGDRPGGVATSGRAGRLSRELIVDTYLRLVEAEGGSASLRRLGEELGVDATAIYRHFRSKDEMLAAATERVLVGVFDGLEQTGTWRDQLRELFLALRRVYFVHPQALLAMQQWPLELEKGFLNVERCIALLRTSGLDEAEIPVAFEALETYTIGATIFDSWATDESLERWRKVYGSLPARRFPNLSHIGDALYRDLDGAFAFGLDCMLDSIAVRAAGPPRTNGRVRRQRDQTTASKEKSR